MNERFTDEQVMTTLRDVVNERPDYVYEEVPCDEETVTDCLYVYNNAPSCLVGHVMHRLGIPLDVLSEHEGESPNQFRPALSISYRAADALTKAQDVQDEGDAWADALEAAERVFGRE